MASSSSSASASQTPPKPPGFIANAMKRKQSFIQFFTMTGILLLSMRSLGQKYRLHHLEDDTTDLKEEHSSLLQRLAQIRKDLLHEASLDPTGGFANRLQLLFGDQQSE